MTTTPLTRYSRTMLRLLTSSPAQRRESPAVARRVSCFADDRPVREDSR